MLDEVFERLKVTPIWFGPVLALVVFVFFRFAIPLLMPSAKPGFSVSSLLLQMLPLLSWLAGGALLLAWFMAELWKLFNRRLLDGQTGLASIRDVSWQEFERLVSEGYRRMGYVAEVVGSASGDGGVDIRLTGFGEKVLVQCKQWRAYTVGVTTVRELLGVVVSQRADKGILVTSGRFTQQAKLFAATNPAIELVDGPALFELIRAVQKSSDKRNAFPGQPTIPVAHSPECPSCRSEMVLRIARKGANPGSRFWGCPNYPRCRGTRPAI